MLLPYAVVFRLHGLMYPTSYPLGEGSTFYRFAFGWIHGNPMIEQVVGILIVFFQAVWINRIMIQHRLSRENTLFAGVFYILLVSLTPAQLGLNPSLIGGFAFIIVLDDILRIYLKKEVASELFNYGFGLGLAWLIYPPYFVLLLSIFAAIAIMRSLNIREILQWAGGVISILFLSLMAYSYVGDWYEMVHDLVQWNPSNLLSWQVNDWRHWVYLAIVVLAVVIIVLNSNLLNRGIAYKERKKWKVIYWVLLLSFFSVFSGLKVEWDRMDLIAIPLSMLLGAVAANSKRTIVVEFLHILIFITVLFLQFN